MTAILSCLPGQHDPLSLVMALVVCVAGAFCVGSLHGRALASAGRARFSWRFLTAFAGGVTIWSTHFIAMLGYAPGVPIRFDAALTIASLLVVIGGTLAGLSVAHWGLPADPAARRAARPGALPLLGGAIVGLAIGAMHFTGMAAYRVDGLVTWNLPLVALSLLLGTLLAALSVDRGCHGARRGGRNLAGTLLLVLAVVSLHFTGMAAFSVQPMDLSELPSGAAPAGALAVVVAVGTLLVIGIAGAAYAIDSGAREEADAEHRRLSRIDGLTGLLNREGMMRALDGMTEAANRAGGQVALIAMDLDAFKEVNALHGHALGDAALRGVAARLRAVIRREDALARIGADEFVALIPLPEPDSLPGMVERLRAAAEAPLLQGAAPFPDAAAPFAPAGPPLALGVSIGTATFPQDVAPGAAPGPCLLEAAALALARARAEGPGHTVRHDPAMEAASRGRRTLRDELSRAVARGELVLHYQRQVEVRTGTLRGYEALIRWHHPARGMVPPLDFIPLAEETGLIRPIGEWVLRQACRDAASWALTDAGAATVAVNLSPIQLADPGLPALVRDALAESGLPPERLELELTESAVVENRDQALRMLREIRALGVGIALDDFGTGYSSLDTLRSFPFTKIKLDRSFMREVETSTQALALIRAVLAMGRGLGMRVLAEGVETWGQAAILGREGCDEAQGYLHGRPGPVEAAALRPVPA